MSNCWKVKSPDASLATTSPSSGNNPDAETVSPTSALDAGRSVPVALVTSVGKLT